MDDLALIESYYAVATHLRQNGEELIRMAEVLASSADRMSELRMKLKQPSSDSANGDANG